MILCTTVFLLFLFLLSKPRPSFPLIQSLGCWTQFQCVFGRGVLPHTTKQFLRYQLVVLQFNSILTLSTQRQSQIPQAKHSVLQDSPHHPISYACHKPRLLFVLLTYWLQVQLNSLGPINLLEWLTELRKSVYSLYDWFIIKGWNSRIATWKKSKRKVCGRRHPCPLGVHRSFEISMSSLLRSLPNPILFVFLWRLYYIGTVD